jgi:hypothetical protein
MTPYNVNENNSIYNNDPDGDCPWCLVSAAIDYGFQVADNYAKGNTGYNAWVGKVNFASVALSAVPGGGIVKTLAIETVKATVEYRPNDGLKVEKSISKISKDALVNTVISKGSEYGAAKIVKGSSDDVLKNANKQARKTTDKTYETANKVKQSQKQLNKTTNTGTQASYNKAVQAHKDAVISSQNARNIQVRTQMANKTVGKIIPQTSKGKKVTENIISKSSETYGQRKYSKSKE